MQRDRELHVQTEEGKSTDLAKPTEPTLRLAAYGRRQPGGRLPSRRRFSALPAR